MAALYVLFLHSSSHLLLERFTAPGFLEPFFANGYLGVPFFVVLSGSFPPLSTPASSKPGVASRGVVYES